MRVLFLFFFILIGCISIPKKSEIKEYETEKFIKEVVEKIPEKELAEKIKKKLRADIEDYKKQETALISAEKISQENLSDARKWHWAVGIGAGFLIVASTVMLLKIF